MLACICGDISEQIARICIYITALYAKFISLLALRHLPSRIKPPPAQARRLQGLQRRAPRVQDVRRVRHFVCEALQGAHRGGGPKKDEANFCDHFKPKAGAYVPKDTAAIERSKSALDDLFRK